MERERDWNGERETGMEREKLGWRERDWDGVTERLSNHCATVPPTVISL